MVVYGEALEDLKSISFDQSALLVVDGHLVKMLATWPMVTTWVEDEEAGDSMHQAWAMTRFDAKEWSQLARLDPEIIMKNWQTLAKLNLIYPDNSLHQKVHSFLLIKANVLLGIE